MFLSSFALLTRSFYHRIDGVNEYIRRCENHVEDDSYQSLENLEDPDDSVEQHSRWKIETTIVALKKFFG